MQTEGTIPSEAGKRSSAGVMRTRGNSPVYQAFSLHNFRKIPQIQKLDPQLIRDIEVVAQVLPFKTNSFVVNELIDWNRVPEDPLFILNFPVRDMLFPEDYSLIDTALQNGASRTEIRELANRIRMKLNPHPAGQMTHNVPTLNGQRLHGVQHKYFETVLFFPAQGQTCHAYCSFCFRWPQFVGIEELKFAMREVELLIEYVRAHPEVSDILFTGGDPLIMRTRVLRSYLEPVIQARIPHLRNIRIGTKAPAYWPYRFLTDPDADDLLRLFEEIVKSGYHLAIMVHFNHVREVQHPDVQKAIARIRETGAQVRTQSPVLRHINDDPDVWANMWREQVRIGAIPYYMFVARDTGAHHFFSLPLVRTWEIFRDAYKQVSGLARTVRGPSMSAFPGKVEVLGPATLNGQKVLALRMIQGRNPDWVYRPFFARWNETATWLDELEPADGDRFFWEEDIDQWVRK